MTTRYILFDINTTNIKIWSKRLGKKYPLDVICSSVDDVTTDIYVSPANGAGQLDGGIDKIYRTMFPGIQPVVNKALSIYKGRIPLLGVGSNGELLALHRTLLHSQVMFDGGRSE